MSANQDQFLNRIRASLRHSLLPGADPEHPGPFTRYSYQADAPPKKLIEDFTHELEALSGHVHILPDGDVLPAILDILRRCQADRILAWEADHLGLPGLREALVEAGIRIESSELPVDREARLARLAALDSVVAGLTGAQAGLADSGALALINGPGRSRLASLLPPVHIALLQARNLYPALPAFLADQPTAATGSSNLVFITGPSRTADIEMTLSMGVHGPREVHAIIVI